LTKSQVISELAETTELDKKSINRVFDGLTGNHQETARITGTGRVQ
jgi:hypothetical protein